MAKNETKIKPTCPACQQPIKVSIKGKRYAWTVESTCGCEGPVVHDIGYKAESGMIPENAAGTVRRRIQAIAKNTARGTVLRAQRAAITGVAR